MRNKLIVGNWKMNKTVSETREFIKHLKAIQILAFDKQVEIGLAPTYLSLELLAKNARSLEVYAQNVHYENSGAFTGEISIPMLAGIGVTGSLVGHSERRIYDNETDQKCALKIRALLANKMKAIYCVGETLDEYNKGISINIVQKQLIEGLRGLEDPGSNLVIAYEPVWSIGTGINASVEIAEKICEFIRIQLKQIFSPFVADRILILYGGSVKPENIKDYLCSPNIDGALVGGASLKPESFMGLIENAK